jgi:hypothetical protein
MSGIDCDGRIAKSNLSARTDGTVPLLKGEGVMRKGITTIVFVLAALMMTVAPTGAGRMWCRADPIVSFNGTPVQVWVEMPADYQYLVNGPIQFEIATPSWVESEVLFTDAGFNGYGEEISFTTNSVGSQSAGDIWSRNESYQGIGVQQPSTFTVSFDVTVPLDDHQLSKDFGTRANAVPVRLRIVDASGFEQVVGGTATGAQIAVMVQGS